MNSIRGKDGMRALKAVMRPGTLLAFDFDGTLAPIARHPDMVKCPPPIEEMLHALSRWTDVAVISGRSRADVRRRFSRGPGTIRLIGNHGMETEGTRSPLQRSMRTWARRIKAELRNIGAGKQAWLEDKNFSLTVHCHRPNILRALNVRLRKGASTGVPVRIFPGIACLNIVAQKAPHKGDAIRALLRKAGSKRAVYVGDDDTDEDVFAMNDRRILTIRVGRRASSNAQFFLPSQKDVAWLLKTMSLWTTDESRKMNR